MTSGTTPDTVGAAVRQCLRESVIVDCETTGLNPATDRIIEIAALRVRSGRPVAVFHRLVDPEQPLPRFITSLTGITDGDLTGAAPLSEVLEDLARFTAHDTVVGHNVRFDLSFIAAGARGAAGRSDAGRPDGLLCTAETARILIPRDRVGRYRLATLADVLELDHRPRHRTVDDVLATLDLLLYLNDV